MLKFFTSIKTSLWIMGLSIGVYVIGSIYIPQNLDIFSEINDMPLFKWFSLNGGYIGKFLWIYLLIGLMALLAIQLIICSLDALIRDLTLQRLVEIVSPQILHAGVILVLFGHLVSAAAGYKQDIPMSVKETRDVKGIRLGLDSLEFVNLKGEDSVRWRVHVTLDGHRRSLEQAIPAFYKGAGFFAKSAQQGKDKAIIWFVYDPGVIWEIIGAVAFVIGAAGVFSIQLRRR